MRVLSTGIQLNVKSQVIVAITYFTFLAWYYVFSYYILGFIIDSSTGTFSIYNTFFNFLVASSLILSSFFIRVTKKTSIICAWSILASIGMVLIVLVPTYVFKSAIYLLLGAVFGMGLLAFFTYFWQLTVPEERGRVAGLTGFFCLPVLSLIIPLVRGLDFLVTSVLTVALSLGALAIRTLNPVERSVSIGRRYPKGLNPERRTVLLYLIPWAVSASINVTLAKAVSFHVSQFLSPSEMWIWALQVIAGGFGAIACGAIADFFGRKYSLVLGFTLYGVSSAISGLTKDLVMLSLMLIGTGLAWGSFTVLFSFVIWGDLADEETYTHRYSIGLATFYFASGAGFLFTPQSLQIPLAVASITSCLLIFLSDIPLILAPELLPLDFREKMRLKSYIRRVKRKKPEHLSHQG